MKKSILTANLTRAEERALVSFRSFLATRAYKRVMIDRHAGFMRRVARWRRLQRGGGLLGLHGRDVDLVLRDMLSGYRPVTVAIARSSLARWFDFRGESLRECKTRTATQRLWCGAYRLFLINHRGLRPDSIADNIREVALLVDALFGKKHARWNEVGVKQIWRYCEGCALGAKPGYANKRLSAIRRFLQFVHSRGACRAALANAVPHVASFAVASQPPAALSEEQRRRFLGAFSKNLPGHRRDLAMCLCMLELGLRSAEVARLRLPDIDLSRRTLQVPAVKNARSRLMPLPSNVAEALRDYIEHERPGAANDALFVRILTRGGEPVAATAVQTAAARAYRRAGLPRHWHGSHRLRHTFASRLFAGGATLKQIADLLGHRRLDTANLYTHADAASLRRVALPWPL